jgi:uncharacterized protein YjbI with pentapeptide repeats
MKAALDQFQTNLARARTLSGVADSIGALTTPAIDVTDIHRASLVLGVSALDYFVHEFVRLGMLEVLRSANLTDAFAVSAHLDGARLDRATLKRTNLTDADLARADLCFADLTDATLTRARLWGVDMDRAKLEGAALENAELIDMCHSLNPLKGVIDMASTKLPPGFKVPEKSGKHPRP